MTESKHTPGPWRAAEKRSPAGVPWDQIVRSVRNGDPVCTVFVAGYMAKEAEANARLIAAAPDLLRELQRFIEGADDDCGDPACSDCATYRAARAAIAKATGPSTTLQVD